MEWMDEFKEMMEDNSENVSEAFICCVCRDLLYKPIILACGHISCFWCVHKSMSGMHKSSCPLCRNQYLYFPYVCQMLHLLLQKLYPKSYTRRGHQTLDEERKMGCFSTDFDAPASHSQPEAASTPSDSTLNAPDVDQAVDQCSIRTGETQPVEHEQAGSVTQGNGLGNSPVHKENISVTNLTASKQMPKDEIASEIRLMVSCGSCKKMLIKPVALNCGHVFCTCCVVMPKDGIIKCEVCQTPHPGAIPKVCLELDHFLEEQFPQGYELRRDNLRKKEEQHPNELQSTCSSESKKDECCLGFPLQWNNNNKVHIGVGCDFCGMFPIIGDRYRCRDCVEQIGFDLCKDCYTSRSKLPGRFNQQHTSDHKFEMVRSNAVHELMLRLFRRSHEAPDSSDAEADGSDIAIYGSDITDEDTDIVFPAPPPPSYAPDRNQQENNPDTS